MGSAEARADGRHLLMTGHDPAWERRLPVDKNGRMILNFHRPNSYPHYSAAAVVQSELLRRQGQPPLLEPGLFTGKHVLFGMTAHGLYDLRPTPVSGVFSGVEIHATMLDNLLSDAFVAPAPLGATVFILMGLPLALAAGLAVRGGLRFQVSCWLAGLTLPPALALISAARGVWLPLAPISAASLLALLGTSLYVHAGKERQKRVIEKAFKHYLAPAVVQRIVDSDEEFGLSGEERELTIFFSDIRGFTSISERLAPEEVVRLLNRYFDPMTRIIREHRGTLDKFIGDAIMAFWNAPEDVPDHSALALAATLAMHAALADLNPELEREFKTRLAFGAGLHRGLVRVGNMGTEELMDYTIIGDNVNLSSRLEGLCSFYGQGLILSGEVKRACGDRFIFQKIGLERVKGRQRPVDIYTAYSQSRAANLEAELSAAQAALALYEQLNFAGARLIYADLAASCPDNKLYKIYVERCRFYLAEPPPPDWDGSFTHQTK
jgi:adenylate cyclase